jgi:hypothetical protein
MFLYINFAIRNRDIGGYIAMIMDYLRSARFACRCAFIERTAGGWSHP